MHFIGKAAQKVTKHFSVYAHFGILTLPTIIRPVAKCPQRVDTEVYALLGRIVRRVLKLYQSASVSRAQKESGIPELGETGK